jgi:hypothetical protein
VAGLLGNARASRELGVESTDFERFCLREKCLPDTFRTNTQKHDERIGACVGLTPKPTGCSLLVEGAKGHNCRVRPSNCDGFPTPRSQGVLD